jgi:hypothetical protein
MVATVMIMRRTPRSLRKARAKRISAEDGTGFAANCLSAHREEPTVTAIGRRPANLNSGRRTR